MVVIHCCSFSNHDPWFSGWHQRSSCRTKRGKRNERISRLLPVFCPITLSALYPEASPKLCSATWSVSTSPSASRRLRISSVSTGPCTSCTTTRVMSRFSLTALKTVSCTEMSDTDSTPRFRCWRGLFAAWGQFPRQIDRPERLLGGKVRERKTA